MADQTPIERLQPCLLDRLTDDEPGRREESRAQRVISDQRYRRGVMRDLEWLFNTHATIESGEGHPLDPKLYPYAYSSVLNYGARQLWGVAVPDHERLSEQLLETIRLFEPRIDPDTVGVDAVVERNVANFEVRGELWTNARSEDLHLKTTVDLETGQCMLGDAPHG
jgi:type VI secretion system protein ImpF